MDSKRQVNRKVNYMDNWPYQPRWYQQDLINRTRQSWMDGYINVLDVSPPRSGKTATAVWLSEPFILNNDGAVIGAHREELVRQISMTFAEFGHYHRVFAPKDVVADIIKRQYKKYGQSFIDQRSYVIVGSVQTMTSKTRLEEIRRIAPHIKLWIVDEAPVSYTHLTLPTNREV